MEYSDSHWANVRSELEGAQYAGKNVLVCWHHGEIPALAAELAKGYTVSGGPPPSGGIPGSWDGKTVYDRIWSLAFQPDAKGGPAVAFSDSSENLPMDQNPTPL